MHEREILLDLAVLRRMARRGVVEHLLDLRHRRVPVVRELASVLCSVW